MKRIKKADTKYQLIITEDAFNKLKCNFLQKN
jgi:hypothetical protein